MEININLIMDLYGEKILKLTHENILLEHEKRSLLSKIKELEEENIGLKEEKNK